MENKEVLILSNVMWNKVVNKVEYCDACIFVNRPTNKHLQSFNATMTRELCNHNYI